MKKKIVALLFITIMSVSVFACGTDNTKTNNKKQIAELNDASDNNKDDYFNWTVDDSLYGLSESGKKQDKIVIPKKCKSISAVIVTKDSSVKEISFDCTVQAEFNANYIAEADTSIEKIDLPEGMETLGTGSFSTEKKLTEITFPSSLTKIEDYAISYCDAFSKVDLSNTNVTSIGKYAFEECNSVKEIYLPDTIQEIGQFAFPKSVTDIYIPEKAEIKSFGEDSVLLANETKVSIHVKKGSWADNNFDNWFNKDPKYTKVYD